MITVATLAAVALSLSTALPTPQIEPSVKNPTKIEFNCPEHDIDSQHEFKIVRIEGTNKIVITTILLGDPAYIDAATKKVGSDLNVQPIAFGEYVATVNSIVVQGDQVFKSVDSVESNLFQRVPGSPSKPIVK